MNNNDARKKGSFAWLSIASLWLLVAGLLTLMLWPDLPATQTQWWLLIGLGPPVYVLGEAFFGWLLSRNHGHSLSPRRFSVVRLIVALPVVLEVFALGWWVTGLLSKV
ncbi:MAG: hypothetical protein M3R45_09535 [Pseudomonadota bacterium]|nr:hypothetical protein [Pseudomonadota bacterium]